MTNTPLVNSQAIPPAALDAEPSAGLSNDEADRRLEQFGPNELRPSKRAGALAQLVQLFANPLVVILLLAAVVSAIVGEGGSALIIIVIVLLGIAVNFLQTYHSERAVRRLRESVAPTATVLREGSWREMPRRLLVPGDIVRLSAGDLVPGDARLLQARDLHVQQAALTGESMPVEKEAAAKHTTSDDDDRGFVYMGTSVVSGTATAAVIATGQRTRFGEIAARLVERPPDTEFDRGTRRFGMLILQAVVFLMLLVFLANIVLQRDPLQSLLFSVALAVGLTPEFLPMIIAVALAGGAVRMSRHKVIVKHLAAMQNFGSMDVLCSDKTGTITSGSMQLAESLDPLGAPNDRVLLLAYLNSFHQTGIKSPLDQAILAHGDPAAEGYTKIDEIPFDFERRRLSIVVERAGKRMLIVKGSPESVLACSSACERDGSAGPLDDEVARACIATYERLSAEGFRVLAVGFREVAVQDAYRADDETGLTLAGFLAFFDPPLEGVSEIIEGLRKDGVRIMILTGDNELVARHVCQSVGIDGSAIVLGSELDRIGDTALGYVVEQTAVFARVSPAQKNRIILALKQRGHVVGFLGDGINDAPSLHAADVGISVASAVDVARDAAEIILLDRSLAALHAGVVEGRKAFGNVMKYLLMGTSSNFGNMISMAAASAFLPFLPMLPMQILLNNFLYDLSQITIPSDNVDETFIRKPRRWDVKLIRNFMLVVGPVSSLFDLLTFFVLLRFFDASSELFHTGWFVESLATQTLVIFVVRTATNPFRSRPSLPLAGSVLAVVAVGLVLPITPWAAALGFTPLPASYLTFVAVVTAVYLLAVELVKRSMLGRKLN